MEPEIKQEFQKIAEQIKNLTSVVQQGFKKHDDEFVKVQASLSKHDEEFVKVHANFKKHDDQFEKVQASLSKHDEEFVKVHANFKKNDEEFSKIRTDLNKHQASLDRHDEEFSKIRTDLNNHQASLNKHDKDIEDLAIMTQRGFDEIREEMKIESEKINDKMDKIITNTDAFYHLHKKLDEELTITQYNCQDLDRRVTVLETAKV